MVKRDSRVPKEDYFSFEPWKSKERVQRLGQKVVERGEKSSDGREKKNEWEKASEGIRRRKKEREMRNEREKKKEKESARAGG